jgi:hypothetical protein
VAGRQGGGRRPAGGRRSWPTSDTRKRSPTTDHGTTVRRHSSGSQTWLDRASRGHSCPVSPCVKRARLRRQMARAS